MFVKRLLLNCKCIQCVDCEGYFRDILRLGQISHGHVSIEKIIDESKMQVQKVREGFNGISIAIPKTRLLLWLVRIQSRHKI